MKMTRFFGFGMLVLLSLVLLFSAALAEEESVDAALLWINPPSSNVPIIGGTKDIVVQLDDVTNVYAIEMELSFNPAILAVVDADPVESGVQISEGSCPAPDFVLTNTADNTTGTIEYVLTQLYPTPPCDGGTVATIEFECLTEGTSQVNFTHSLISDPDGLIVSAPTQDATLTCGEENNPPYTPGNPTPSHNATGVSVTTDLSWTGGDPDAGNTVTYDVKFGTSSPPATLLCDDTPATTCDPGTLSLNTTYYWQVIAIDNHGASTTGDIWHFTTSDEEPDKNLYLPLVVK